MNDPSLLYLKMLAVEQTGWLTLRLQDQLPVTAQATIGHLGSDFVILLSSCQRQIDVEQIKQIEYRYINPSGIYTLTSSHFTAEMKDQGKLMVHMLPPYSMTHRQQREFIRFEPETPIPLSFTPLYPDDYQPGTGLIKDMSGNGLRFVTDQFVHKESILSIAFSLPETEHPVHGVGQVVRKEFTNGETITSLRFLDIKPQDQRTIISLSVAEQLRIAENQIKQKRKFARITPSLPLSVKLRGIDNQRMHESSALNLGGGGMFVTSLEPVHPFPLYHLSFQLPSSRQDISAYVKVVEHHDNQEQYFYHLEFVDIHPQDQEAIVQYVLEQQLSLLNEQDEIVKPATKP